MNAPVLIFFDSLPLINRACGVRKEEQIGFRRAISPVIGDEGVHSGVVIIVILISFVRPNNFDDA
jgi:hypothetical protein